MSGIHLIVYEYRVDKPRRLLLDYKNGLSSSLISISLSLLDGFRLYVLLPGNFFFLKVNSQVCKLDLSLIHVMAGQVVTYYFTYLRMRYTTTNVPRMERTKVKITAIPIFSAMDISLRREASFGEEMEPSKLGLSFLPCKSMTRNPAMALPAPFIMAFRNFWPSTIVLLLLVVIMTAIWRWRTSGGKRLVLTIMMLSAVKLPGLVAWLSRLDLEKKRFMKKTILLTLTHREPRWLFYLVDVLLQSLQYLFRTLASELLNSWGFHYNRQKDEWYLLTVTIVIMLYLLRCTYFVDISFEKNAYNARTLNKKDNCE